ncbi:MAG TPA: C25 family cysteine peptidase, partial [Candidatus Binatia bacterium]|nr:C25 family cysteine peptidase [Candidatus Binatia bacterium]
MRALPAVLIALGLGPLVPAPAQAQLPPRAHRAAPDPRRAAPFQPTVQPSGLGSPVDCVIVAPDSLADVYQKLADYQTRIGIATVVRNLSTIRAADPRSNDLPQAIRSFLKAARDLWGARWAVLAGDHDTIPMRYARVTYSETVDIPTDAYYSDLDGTWDGNGNGIYGEVADSLDMNPDIAVGRLSASTRAQAQVLVSKALRYATSPLAAPLTKELILAEVLFPTTWQPGQLVSVDGALQGESLKVRAPACVTVDRYYENAVPYPGSLLLTKATALSALGRGYGIVNHIGHGARSQLSIGNELITMPDLAGLANGDSIGLWIASNCASAAVDYECVAEEVVRNPNGGALAYLGATRDAWPGVDVQVSTRLIDLLERGPATTLGEAVEDTRASLLPLARGETQERWGYFETVLLGDPAIPLWRCAPATLTVTRPGTVPLSGGGFPVTVLASGVPVDSALVVAWKQGEEYRVGHTNAAGQVTLPFHAGSTGKFSFSVTSPGALPFLDSLTVVSDAPSHFALVGFGVRDSIAGDGDGKAEAGETFAIAGAVKNAGSGASTGALTVTLVPLTGGLAVPQGTAILPALAPGATATLPDSLRVRALAIPGTARGEMLRVIARDGTRADTTDVPVAVAAASPLLASNGFDDSAGAGGNGNGGVDPNETVGYRFAVANEGSGRARGLTIHLRNPAAGVAILDSTASLGDVAPGAVATSALVHIHTSGVVPPGRLFDVRIDDAYFHSSTFAVDHVAPSAPANLHIEIPGADRVTISWDPVAAGDASGYRLYRGPDDGSPLTLLTPVPVRRVSSYEDAGLPPLTRYRYAAAAVDSGGNESPLSAALVASTNPPALQGWPEPLGEATSSSVCLADLDGDGKPEVLVGADYLYVFRPDGTDWHDGDANTATTGIFSTALHHIPSSPAAADLDGDGVPEIIAASWDDSTVAVWHANGTMLPGWPRKGGAPFWSTPAIGDIDGDGAPEIVVGSNTNALYAWHVNGAPLRGTSGVLFAPQGSVISSPAIADLNGDGVREIIFGTSAGHVYAIHADSSMVWDASFSGLASSSPAVGQVIPGGGLEVVFGCMNDSVYVLTSTGQRAPGWPRPLELTTGNGRVPSPALAALLAPLGDPRLDVVAVGADGRVMAWDPQGNVLPGFANVTLGGAVTEASPAVADLDGDGKLEILIGGEDRRLYAFRFDGTPVSGFPIEIGAEARSTPAVWDLDRDGATDIVFAGWDRAVHAWRYPGTFLSAGMAWPMFHHDNWRTGYATFPILTAVDTLPSPPQTPPSAPRFSSLAQNRPNPFNPVTTIGYSVAGRGLRRVLIQIFDVRGRLVATPVSRTRDPGYYEFRWDGRDRDGREVSSGVYF